MSYVAVRQQNKQTPAKTYCNLLGGCNQAYLKWSLWNSLVEPRLRNKLKMYYSSPTFHMTAKRKRCSLKIQILWFQHSTHFCFQKVCVSRQSDVDVCSSFFFFFWCMFTSFCFGRTNWGSVVSQQNSCIGPSNQCKHLLTVLIFKMAL